MGAEAKVSEQEARFFADHASRTCPEAAGTGSEAGGNAPEASGTIVDKNRFQPH